MNFFRNLVLLLFPLLILSCSSDSNSGGEGTEFGSLFVTSNTTAIVGIYDFSQPSNPESVQFGILSTDSDGVIYSPVSDELYITSRTNNRVEQYSDLLSTDANTNLTNTLNSSSDFSNARKMAVLGSRVLVAQDAGISNNQENRFFVYEVSGSEITLQNTYDPQINLWDVQFVGNDLYAVEDNSDSLAIFNDVLSNQDGVISADIKVQIEGIVRTHALYYDSSSDIMFMSDIGSANSDSDGAMHIITGFAAKLSAAGNGGSISLSDQIVIAGSNTQLGNPVGVTYDPTSQLMFVAERAVDGGRILAFTLPQSNGNPSPDFSETFNGAAAVYLASGN